MESANSSAISVTTSSNWAESPSGAVAAGAIVAAELTPLNETLRFAAFAGTLAATKDPILASAAIAGTSLLLEGGAAISTADLLATRRGASAVDKINEKVDGLGVGRILKSNLPTEFALANLGGSAIATAYKHRQDPERTRQQNRRYGVKMAAGLAAINAAGGYMVAEGISHPNPLSISIGAVAVGGVVGSIKWARNRIKQQSSEVRQSIRNNVTESPQKLGLSAEDETAVLDDPRTVSIEHEGESVPVLAPIDRLHWYNTDYLSERFGTEEIFYFAHPRVDDQTSRDKVLPIIEEKISEGAVVLYDTVTADNKVYGDLAEELESTDAEYNKVAITKSGRQRFLYQYDGEFVLNADKHAPYRESAGVYEVYEQAVQNGNLDIDEQNGPALKDKIEGEDAERLWSIYRAPFDKLSAGHPIDSGYSRDEFFEMLRDPETVKAIYREDGTITTLAFFVGNLDHAPWLNKDHYEEKYPEAVKTGNHFVFPGIVTDELKRGASYSVPLMKLLSRVQGMRQSPAIISFECTDISYKYVPKIVRYAVRRSGVAKMCGLKQPKSRFDYYAITK